VRPKGRHEGLTPSGPHSWETADRRYRIVRGRNRWNETVFGLYDEGGNSRDFVTPITSADQINRAYVPGGQVSAADAAASAFPRLGDFRYAAWNGGQDARAYILDGSFVRLRDVSLSYDAPRAVAASVGARSLRVNLQGRNLLLFSKFWSFDPEFNNFGNTNLNRFIDLAPFPGARQFAVSVDVGF
jgi:hypothetical protein